MSQPVIRLGERYRDALTDFEGVAIARSEYLHGCPKVSLQRLDSYGAPQEFWFDEARLALPAARETGFAVQQPGRPPQPE